MAHGKCVDKRRDAALGGRVTLGLGLTHAVTGRRNVHDGRTGSEIREKKLCEIKRCRDTDTKSVVKLVP